MSQFPSLPLFTDAFLADTGHLTAQETGAYLLLLMMAWRLPECRLPDDDQKLSRWARVDSRTWKRIKPAIMEFWTFEEGFWTQKRLSKERSVVSKRAEVARDNGKHGGRPKSLENNEAQNPAGSSQVTQQKAPNPNPSKEYSDTSVSEMSADIAPREVSINDQIWNTKAALSDLSGKSPESVGKWIGKALKDHPPDVVKQGIDAALHAGTRDPFSYARSVMLNTRGPQNDQQGNRNGRTNSAARSTGTAARVAALMGYDDEHGGDDAAEERRVSDRASWPEGRNPSRFLDAEPDTAGVYRA
ncbi:YdaU family protein [Microvirga mediterraneensis]|uniref:DUF1376 domain-containing protein n=1 Tax=Microvirga mediterraneensis TaxID=2754695 RepID=A0A838BPW1_9HYPH|nr:DUF1376 domain-containing protein [Microvirga mediterraneensis]MBA1157784.1 DUF1376 domain-containing protein [Microvirga mediterraneensis]